MMKGRTVGIVIIGILVAVIVLGILSNRAKGQEQRGLSGNINIKPAIIREDAKIMLQCIKDAKAIWLEGMNYAYTRDSDEAAIGRIATRLYDTRNPPIIRLSGSITTW